MKRSADFFCVYIQRQMNGMESFPPFLDTLLVCIPGSSTQTRDNTDRLNSFLKGKKRQITAVEEQVISVGYVVG